MMISPGSIKCVPAEHWGRCNRLSPSSKISGLVPMVERMLVPTYLGRRVTKINLDQVPPELNISWLVAAVLFDIEETATILEVHRMKEKNWSGMGMQLLVQIEQDSINAIPDAINLPDGSRIHVAVEGHRPKCYLCSSEQHLKKDCPFNKQRLEADKKRKFLQQHQQQQQPKASTPPTPSPPTPRKATPPSPAITKPTPAPTPRTSTPKKKTTEPTTTEPATTTTTEIVKEFSPDPKDIPFLYQISSDCVSTDSEKGEWHTVPPKKKRRSKTKETSDKEGRREKGELPNIIINNNNNTHSQQIATPSPPQTPAFTHATNVTAINTKNEHLLNFLKNSTNTNISNFNIPLHNTPPAHILTPKISEENYNKIKEKFPNDVGSPGRSFSQKLYRKLVEAPTRNIGEPPHQKTIMPQ
ncbi:uncharacterized protein LOC106877403 [Octopus bimaculoides]|uniref:uncharacterized protein LOC106877403 n=1 Tax=Octopus bimaculoides TaxID=37653 RepID=UPI0022E887CF|nr:uncharacterized protein LOC106877403 [Octopus bimaculoides]